MRGVSVVMVALSHLVRTILPSWSAFVKDNRNDSRTLNAGRCFSSESFGSIGDQKGISKGQPTRFWSCCVLSTNPLTYEYLTQPVRESYE